jgi:DNA-binding Xre family transcriptional regulator
MISAERIASLFAGLRVEAAGPSPRTEADLAALVAAHLRMQGWEVAGNVPCAAGEADLVARRTGATAILETKFRLDRRAILSGCTQLLLYRQAIDPAALLLIIGFATAHTAALIPQAASLGITVVGIRNDEAGSRKTGQNRSVLNVQTSAFSVQPSPLMWNLKPLACSRGITTVPQLAAVVGLSRQALYPIWRGEAVQVSVAALGKLCLGLDARPGDWFVWEGEGSERRLAWNVAAIAARVRLSPPQLAFRSGIYYRMVRLYTSGSAQSVFLATLGKLAAALTTADHPFSVGEVFTKTDA